MMQMAQKSAIQQYFVASSMDCLPIFGLTLDSSMATFESIALYGVGCLVVLGVALKFAMNPKLLKSFSLLYDVVAPNLGASSLPPNASLRPLKAIQTLKTHPRK